MFAEHGFGIGYTVNLGKPKGVAFTAAFFVLIVVLPLVLVLLG